MIITKTRPSGWLISLLIFLSCSVFQGALQAQEVTEISTEQFGISVRKEYRKFFEDTTGALTIADILNSDWFDRDIQGPNSPTGFYWIRLTLLNTTPFDMEVVATGPRTINSTLFVREGHGLLEAPFGTFQPKKNINPADGRFHVYFHLKAGEPTDVYFRVNGRAFNPSFSDALSFREAQQKQKTQDFIFFGACVILIIYTLIQFLVYRKRMFLYLALFAFGYAMYAFSVRGYFIDWFMPNLPEEGLNFTLVWLQTGHLGGLLLAINFLQLKQKFPVWHKIFLGLIGVMIFRTGYGLYLTAVHLDYGGMTNMSMYTLMIDIVFFKVLLFSLWKKVNTSRKVFLSGLVLFGFVLIMGIIVWRFNFIQDFRLALLYISSTASLSQVIIFSIALGIQMRQHEVDKNVALDELNSVLREQNRKVEIEVVERTTEINRQKVQLQDRNDRIETLFKEVHHRVKNNLQLISSLLNMQQEWSSTEDPAKVIEDSRSRVVAMSMIHQFLYRTDDIATIDFKEYTEELVNKLDAIQVNRVPYRLHLDFKSNPAFDIDTSISLGLILNELVTNSYKHALLLQRDLELKVGLTDLGQGMFALAYKDNGEAIRQPFSEVVKKGFGLRMASRLARQLQGKMDYTYQKGNLFTITFANEEARIALSE